MREVRQMSGGVEAPKRAEEMADQLSWQGKDYDRSIVPEQLGLRERERDQQLAHGAHRWSLWMGSGGTWSGISDGLVDDSWALSKPYTYSESWGRLPLSLFCSSQVMFTNAGKQETEGITSSDWLSPWNIFTLATWHMTVLMLSRLLMW